MEIRFDKKTAIVTGAAGAIGKAIAKKLVASGANVVITDINAEAVAATAKELGCMGIATDVTSEEGVKNVVQTTANTYGGVDILYNVAGIIGTCPIEDMTVSLWDKIMAVNCTGTMLFCKYAVPYMKKNKSGKIVNFSSKSGKTGSALMSHYCAAKGAIISFTQALAYELAPFNINVNCMCPGITDNTGVWDTCSEGYIKDMNLPKDEVVKKFTSKVPLGRLASVEEVSSVAVFMASSQADYMTGQAINVTGGREMH